MTASANGYMKFLFKPVTVAFLQAISGQTPINTIRTKAKGTKVSLKYPALTLAW